MYGGLIRSPRASNEIFPVTRDELVNDLRILAGTLKDRPRALFGSI